MAKRLLNAYGLYTNLGNQIVKKHVEARISQLLDEIFEEGQKAGADLGDLNQMLMATIQLLSARKRANLYKKNEEKK